MRLAFFLATLLAPVVATVLERTALLEGNIADTVAEGRGFLLDPTLERQARVEADFAAVHEDLAALAALTADNPLQRDAIAHLGPLIDARLAVLRDVMQHATSSELPEISRKFRGSRPSTWWKLGCG